MNERKNYLVFASSDALERFFKRKIHPKTENGIEYCVMERFAGNRILFTAEHAQTKRIVVESLDTHEYVGVGDKNTDVLVKIAAYYLRSAYIMPLFVRTEADASRPPEDLGRGLRLFVTVKRSGRDVKGRSSGYKTSYIQIHKDSSMLPKLLKYHQTIEKLDPRTIVSLHGLSRKREYDMLFGFGHDYECIGGKNQAFKFKNEFTEYLGSVFREIGVRSNLKIAVSTWKFTGSKNHVLVNHVIEHNKKTTDPKKKRIGLQAELNLRGRVTKNDDSIPTIPYQLVVQALGDFVFKWNNRRQQQQ